MTQQAPTGGAGGSTLGVEPLPEKVIEVTAQQDLPVDERHPYRTWAWAALVLTPLAWATGLVGGLLAGEGKGNGLVEALVGLVGLLVMLAAPTAAVMLATSSVVRQEPASRVVLVVAVIALLVTLVAMPLLLASGWVSLVATVVVLVALAVFARSTLPARR